MEDLDKNSKSHFFVTQAQVVLLGIFEYNLSINLMMCIPYLFLLIWIEYDQYWKPKKYLTKQYNKAKIFQFVVFGFAFFAIFYGSVHPTASLRFEKVENCFITGHFQNQSINMKNILSFMPTLIMMDNSFQVMHVLQIKMKNY